MPLANFILYTNKWRDKVADWHRFMEWSIQRLQMRKMQLRLESAYLRQLSGTKSSTMVVRCAHIICLPAFLEKTT